MSHVLDAADRVFWWLRDHLLVAALLVLAIVALLVALAKAGGSDGPAVPAGAVAVVGSASIPESGMTHWQEVFSQASTATGAAKPTPARAKKAAFELLTGAAWITEEARKLGVTVSDAEVTKSIDAYFQQAGATTPAARTQLQQQLGTTEADMRFQQRTALLAAALQNRVAKAVKPPSAATIKATYDKEPQRWATPTKRDLRAVIAGNEATAQQAAAALKAGQSWGDVNTKYSNNPTLTKAKGVISGLTNGQSGDLVDRAVFSAPKGVLQGPVDIGAGFMVFQVQKITPLPAQTLAQATPAITASLTTAARSKATNAYLDDLHRRWKAKTRCAPTISDPEYCSAA